MEWPQAKVHVLHSGENHHPYPEHLLKYVDRSDNTLLLSDTAPPPPPPPPPPDCMNSVNCNSSAACNSGRGLLAPLRGYGALPLNYAPTVVPSNNGVPGRNQSIIPAIKGVRVRQDCPYCGVSLGKSSYYEHLLLCSKTALSRFLVKMKMLMHPRPPRLLLSPLKVYICSYT